MENKIQYEGLNPQRSYDTESIIQHYEDFQKLMNYRNMLSKDPENPTAFEKSGELLRNNDIDFYYKAKRSPRSDLELILSQESDNFAKFARKHKEEIYDKLEAKNWAELVQKLPMYKIGKEKHDEFVDALNKRRKMGEINEDPKQIYEYVKNRVIDSGQDWAIRSFARFGPTDAGIMFNKYIEIANQKVALKMVDEHGKLKKAFLRGVFEDSLAEAEKDLKDETYSKDEINDVYDNNIKPYYFALFEEAYKLEKPDEPSTQAKDDRNERRKERREKGMSS